MTTPLIVDGNNVARRFWHANPGDALRLFRVLLREHAQRLPVPSSLPLVICFDGQQRAQIEGYKAGRPDASDDCREFLQQCRDAATRLGCVIERPEQEADTVICGVVRWLREQERGAFILSSDKDLLQLVSDSAPPVRVIRPRTGDGYHLLDEAGVRASFKVAPSQVPDYLALVGDSSDTIKGVPGIGPVAAVKLLTEFGSLRAILQKLECVERKYRKLLEDALDDDLIVPAYRLTKLRSEPVPVTFQASSKLAFLRG